MAKQSASPTKRLSSGFNLRLTPSDPLPKSGESHRRGKKWVIANDKAVFYHRRGGHKLQLSFEN
jgi:hypothetical protein